jgi:hypothetical protein
MQIWVHIVFVIRFSSFACYDAVSYYDTTISSHFVNCCVTLMFWQHSIHDLWYFYYGKEMANILYDCEKFELGGGPGGGGGRRRPRPPPRSQTEKLPGSQLVPKSGSQRTGEEEVPARLLGGAGRTCVGGSASLVEQVRPRAEAVDAFCHSYTSLLNIHQQGFAFKRNGTKSQRIIDTHKREIEAFGSGWYALRPWGHWRSFIEAKPCHGPPSTNAFAPLSMIVQ